MKVAEWASRSRGLAVLSIVEFCIQSYQYWTVNSKDFRVILAGVLTWTGGYHNLFLITIELGKKYFREILGRKKPP